jgi:hypothetical protein
VLAWCQPAATGGSQRHEWHEPFIGVQLECSTSPTADSAVVEAT